MSNIYKIKTNDINEFVKYNSTNKLILFYKQDCLACKLQLEDIKKLSEIYKENIEYAICDVQGQNKFCIHNKIIHVPVIQLYKDGKLIKQLESRQQYDTLENEIISS